MSEAFFVKPSSKVKAWCKRKYRPTQYTPLCFQNIKIDETNINSELFNAKLPTSTVELGCYQYDTTEDTFVLQDEIRVSLQYSVDDMQTWQEWDGSEIELVGEPGNGAKVYIKALDNNERFSNIDDLLAIEQGGGFTDDMYLHVFKFTGKIKTTGSVQYLLDATGKQNYVTNGCFTGLFSIGIVSEYATDVMTTAPALPATQLAKGCYTYMFGGQLGITTAPALPATTLAEQCYVGMFISTGICDDVILPATTLDVYCYFFMLYDVSDIVIHMTGIEEGEYDESEHGEIAESGYYEIEYGPIPTPIPFTGEPLCFEAAQANSSVSLINIKMYDDEPEQFPIKMSLQMSSDKQNWQEWDGSIIDLQNVNDKVYIKALNANKTTYDTENNSYHHFVMTGLIKSSGILESILDSQYQTQKLRVSAFDTLFFDCSSLITPPELTCTKLNTHCYYDMFNGCTSLTAIPALLATTAAEYCYCYMFYGCTSLSSIPNEFKATSCEEGAFCYMFAGCSSLTSIMNGLSADTLTKYSCANMFEDCLSLTAIPKIYATNLKYACLDKFKTNCPESEIDFDFVNISYDQLALQIKTNMPFGPYEKDLNVKCSDGNIYTLTEELLVPEYELTSTNVYYHGHYSSHEETDIIIGTVTSTNEDLKNHIVKIQFNGADEVYGFTGEIEYEIDIAASTINANTGYVYGLNENDIGCFEQYGVPDYYFDIWVKLPISPKSTQHIEGTVCFTAKEANSTVGMTCTKYTETDAYQIPMTVSLQVSNDKENWTNWTGEIITLANVGDKVYVKAGTANAYFETSYFETCEQTTNQFVMTGKIAASGNIMFLLDPTGTSTTLNGIYTSECIKSALYGIFIDCTALEDASELTFPATTLAVECYASMFTGCTSLTAAPALPATTMVESCYNSMFYGCTALSSMPTLPATTLADSCYSYMFQNCSALSSMPALPAATIKNSCYEHMFENDTNITEVNMPNITESEYTSASAGSLAQSHTITIHFKSEPSTENPVCFTATQAGSTVAMTCYEANSEGEMQTVPIKASMQYSVDNQSTWQLWDGSIITLTNVGDKVFIKASANNGAFCNYDVFEEDMSEGDYMHNFILTGKLEGSGNIQYLLDPTGQKTDVPDYAFEGLFVNNAGINSTRTNAGGIYALTKTPDLSATTLAECCYSVMFVYNSDLVKAPDLPANTAPANCYREMFLGCNNIEEPVKIYATSFGDYSCDHIVDTDIIDPAYHFMQMSHNNVKDAIANNNTIFGDDYYFNAKCSDGETYLFTSEEPPQKYQLTGTDVYYYGEYDEYAPSTTIIGTVTSTSEELTDTGVLSVQFNGASQIGGFNELVKFTILADSELNASKGSAGDLNYQTVGDFNYQDFNEAESDIWVKLPIEKVEE